MTKPHRASFIVGPVPEIVQDIVETLISQMPPAPHRTARKAGPGIKNKPAGAVAGANPFDSEAALIAQRYLDTAELIILGLDLDGRITLVNRHACSILGWTAEELLGNHWIETCLPVRIRRPIRRSFHDILRGELRHIENPIVTKSGDERLIAWHNALRRNAAGEIIGTLSSGADITHRDHAGARAERLDNDIQRGRVAPDS